MNPINQLVSSRDQAQRMADVYDALHFSLIAASCLFAHLGLAWEDAALQLTESGDAIVTWRKGTRYVSLSVTPGNPVLRVWRWCDTGTASCTPFYCDHTQREPPGAWLTFVEDTFGTNE